MGKYSAVGEPETEFEKADDKGEFNCGNCVHMDGEVCKHPVMAIFSKQPRKGKFPVVDKDDCCRFVKRPD